MKKSVLIIDTPRCCGACDFLQVGNPGWYCDRNGEYVSGHIVDSKRADFCPLQPLPEINEKEYVTEFGNSYRDGWNDCIRQIEQERGNCHAGCDRKGTN